MNAVDLQALISKVREYPILYNGNKSCDKDERHAAWLQVLAGVIPGFHDFSTREKSRLGKFTPFYF